MQEQPLQNQTPDSRPRRANRPASGVIAALSAVVLAAGGVTTWLTLKQAPSPVTPAPTQSTIQPNQAQIPVEQTVQVYLVKDTGTRLELVPTPVSVVASNQPAEVLKAAFAKLLEQHSTGAATSTIPENTQVRSLEVRSDGVHVDLSQEFTTGGGSAAMMGRLGQVVYTATTLDPTAKVWISIEGKPLEVLGGEGLMVDQPMTRNSFDENFSL